MVSDMYGQFTATVDGKWRVLIPSIWKKYLRDSVFVVGENDYIRVYIRNVFSKKDFPFVFEVPVRSQFRVIIPGYFRENRVFCFCNEKKVVVLAGFGDYFEVWPLHDKKGNQ